MMAKIKIPTNGNEAGHDRQNCSIDDNRIASKLDCTENSDKIIRPNLSDQNIKSNHNRSISAIKSNNQTRICNRSVVSESSSAVHQNQHHQRHSSTPALSASSPRRVAISKARRELFQKQSNYQANNKWWRSCWNGNQLDGELLYQTVKEQQERRLASLASQSVSEVTKNMDQRKLRVEDEEKNSKQLVYAVPRPQHVTSTMICANNSKLVEKRLSESEEDDEDDPLSDPLYASVLGTSKQLKAIAANKSSSTPIVSNRPHVTHRSLVNNDQYAFVRAIETKQSDKSITSMSCQGERGNDQNESEDGRIRTLVERCLEVQRATTTQNGSLLVIRPEFLEDDCERGGGGGGEWEHGRDQSERDEDKEASSSNHNKTSSTRAHQAQDHNQEKPSIENNGKRTSDCVAREPSGQFNSATSGRHHHKV